MQMEKRPRSATKSRERQLRMKTALRRFSDLVVNISVNRRTMAAPIWAPIVMQRLVAVVWTMKTSWILASTLVWPSGARMRKFCSNGLKEALALNRYASIA